MGAIPACYFGKGQKGALGKDSQKRTLGKGAMERSRSVEMADVDLRLVGIE
jgi:hypothetical protein